MRFFGCVTLLAVVLPLSARETKFNPASRARALGELIDENTIALIHIDLARMDADAMAKTLLPMAPAQKDDVEQLVKQLKAFRTAFTKAGGTELAVAFSSEELPGISVVRVPLSDRSDEPALSRLLKAHLSEGTVVEKRDSALLAGPREALARLTGAKPSTRADLPAAVTAGTDATVQVLILPTADHRRIIDEVVTLPVRTDLSKAVTRGIRWAALGIDVGAKSRAELTLQTTNADAARKIGELIATGVAFLGKMKFLGEDKPLADLLAGEYETLAGALKPKVSDSRVVVQLSQPDAVRAAALIADTIHERTSSVEHSAPGKSFQEILIAFHNYHDATGSLPPHAIYSTDGKPLLSWRVALLPYVGRDALYRQFKLDEPWDSPHNKKLIDRMPKIYRSPKIKDPRPGLTTYLAPINKAFISTGEKEGLHIKDITDGTSRTAMVVDVSDQVGVIWTNPADLIVDAKDPWKGLLGHYPDFVLFGMADGTVRRVPKTLKPKTIWALFTRAGGEATPDLRE
jgi:hypothetical protein